MDINKLRHRATIEENTGTANDGGGNQVPVWEPIATTWANIRPLRGDEVVIANKTGQEVTHMVTMRYRADIDKEIHRINYKGRILAIQHIVNKDELNVELNITCREG
jgi:SPP1 family predicted phage head-tail adaptor